MSRPAVLFDVYVEGVAVAFTLREVKKERELLRGSHFGVRFILFRLYIASIFFPLPILLFSC